MVPFDGVADLDAVAALESEVRHDRRHEPLGHVIDRGELLAAAVQAGVAPVQETDQESEAAPSLPSVNELPGVGWPAVAPKATEAGVRVRWPLATVAETAAEVLVLPAAS